jgi:hypothetical protein
VGHIITRRTGAGGGHSIIRRTNARGKSRKEQKTRTQNTRRRACISPSSASAASHACARSHALSAAECDRVVVSYF